MRYTLIKRLWLKPQLKKSVKSLEMAFADNDMDRFRLLESHILNELGYGIDHDLWIAFTRLRMRFHYRLGENRLAWQLGNNLIHMMGDTDDGTIELHDQISQKMKEEGGAKEG